MVSMMFVTYQIELSYPLTIFQCFSWWSLTFRREVPEHFVLDYKNADWALFRREMDSRMDLNFSLNRVESGADVDFTFTEAFTEAVLEARPAAVPLVCLNRFCFAFSPQKRVL
jgi:hypothetical protein